MLREGGRTVGGRKLHRALNGLIVVEVALSLVLLVGAGLLLRSFVNQRNIDTGYRTDCVLAARTSLPGHYTVARATTVFNETVTRLSALPGVHSVAAAGCLPSAGCAATTVWRLDQEPPPDGQRQSSQIRTVSPAFFKTMDIAQVAGRDFSNSDTADSPPVVIVSESVMRDYFDGAQPLDGELHINNIDHASGSSDMRWRIVGVVRDVRSSIDGNASRVVYVPLSQMPGRGVSMLVRAEGDAMTLAPAVTRTVRAMEPESPIDVRSFDDVVAGTIARPRAITVLVGVFALLTLTLASIGVYGVIAYSVRERTQEIGVRLALGATALEVCRMVMSRALRLAAVGVVVGVISAGVFTRALGAVAVPRRSARSVDVCGAPAVDPAGRRDRGIRSGSPWHAHVTQRSAARLNGGGSAFQKRRRAPSQARNGAWSVARGNAPLIAANGRATNTPDSVKPPGPSWAPVA